MNCGDKEKGLQANVYKFLTFLTILIKDRVETEYRENRWYSFHILLQILIQSKFKDF